ncbi:MAG: Spore protein SP21 [Phycisphaerae bacterium]|nr:Spore protein SP21 [Phycisphaerae bacterium]
MAKNESNDVRVTRGKTERTEGGPSRAPYVDIYETESGLTLVAELPGVSADGLAVEVEKGVLTISGKADAPALEGYRPVYEGMALGGSFFRAFALSDEVDREATTASLKEGVLTVQMPKAPQARTRRIDVEGA